MVYVFLLSQSNRIKLELQTVIEQLVEIAISIYFTDNNLS